MLEERVVHTGLDFEVGVGGDHKRRNGVAELDKETL